MTYLALVVEVLEELSGDFHENNLILDAGGEEVIGIDILNLLARLKAEKSLPLDRLRIGRHGGEGDGLSGQLRNKDEVQGRIEVPDSTAKSTQEG